MLYFKTQVLEAEDHARFSTVLQALQKNGIACATRRTNICNRTIYRIYISGTDYSSALQAIKNI